MDENHACSDKGSAGGAAPESAGMAGGVSAGPAQPGSMNAAAGGSPQSGEMNAHDIPRYDSQGYVAGRPDTPNDPTSAGKLQGAPAEAAQQAAEGYGGPTQTPGPQPPPQGMAYGGTDPAYGQAPPGVNLMGQPGVPPPQGMAHGGADPAYGAWP